MAVGRGGFGQQEAGHLVQIMQAGHHHERALGIACNGVGIIKIAHGAA